MWFPCLRKTMSEYIKHTVHQLDAVKKYIVNTSIEFYKYQQNRKSSASAQYTRRTPQWQWVNGFNHFFIPKLNTHLPCLSCRQSDFKFGNTIASLQPVSQNSDRSNISLDKITWVSDFIEHIELTAHHRAE